MIAVLLGILWGFYALLVLVCMFLLWNHDHDNNTTTIDENSDMATTMKVGFWSYERIQLLLQWSMYVLIICTFHLSEFFVTAVYNPTVTNSDSFLVNHSTAYSVAFMSSCMEFWIRFFLAPTMTSFKMFSWGVMVVMVAQGIRSLAMATCGASFNHLIQTQKKDDHVLITHGIYKYLRHPSYVGFFYWSIATQVVLCNVFNTILYALASCMFFQRRIPYEEESLVCHFPHGEYADYASRTYIGIPFVRPFLSKRYSTTTTENHPNNENDETKQE